LGEEELLQVSSFSSGSIIDKGWGECEAAPIENWFLKAPAASPTSIHTSEFFHVGIELPTL
jgi:hypothetical protein